MSIELRQSWIFRSAHHPQRLAGAFLAIVLVGLLGHDDAVAVPVYAYSKNGVVMFDPEGAVSGVVERRYSSGHSATFSGFGTDRHPRGGESGASNLPQSKVGNAGPSFPAEDKFAQHGKQGTGYARADTEPGFENRIGRNVAEAYRTTPGTADASAFVALRDMFMTNGGEIKFSFDALPLMVVMTEQKGDRARATLQASLLVYFTPADGNASLVFVWQPCGNAADAECFSLKDDAFSVNSVVDQFDLNESILCTAGPCMKTWPDNGVERLFNYSLNLNGFSKGKVESIFFFEERVHVRAGPVPAPEPSGLGLMLGGIAVALALRAQRRSAVHDQGKLPAALH